MSYQFGRESLSMIRRWFFAGTSTRKWIGDADRVNPREASFESDRWNAPDRQRREENEVLSWDSLLDVAEGDHTGGIVGRTSVRIDEAFVGHTGKATVPVYSERYRPRRRVRLLPLLLLEGALWFGATGDVF
jgi:hypothetical protein